MKTRFNMVGIFLIAVSLLTACRKEGETGSTSQINVPKFEGCYNSHLHDSTTVANELIGTWDWQEQGCMNNSSAASPSNVVKATFNSSGFFAVTENSNVVALGSWKIKMFGNNFFGVDSTAFEFEISQPSEYLYGIILLCDNQLLLCGSYADGCNTLFTKEQ